MPAANLTREPLASRRGSGPDLAELSLLLPTWQINRLSELAQERGMNVGQFLRGIIQQVANPLPHVHEN